jgi:cytochrome c553
MHYSKIKYLIIIIATLFFSNSMAEEEYASIRGKYASVKDTLQTCFVCHGENGASTITSNPVLSGQEFYYLYVQLKDFKSGLRDNVIMSPIVANIEKSDLRLMAEYFSEQKWPELDYKVDAKQKALGKQVIDAGQCPACHLGDFSGDSRNPKLSNQHFDYLQNTMLAFKNKTRKNAQPMNSLFATFSDEEINAVAKYLSSIK